MMKKTMEARKGYNSIIREQDSGLQMSIDFKAKLSHFDRLHAVWGPSDFEGAYGSLA